jgi:truncated hemoglobin YjbI
MTSPPNQSADSPSPALPSVYDELGQEPAITEAVDRFYRRVLDDPALAPVFDGIDMDRLKDHQVALLVKVLGGPDRYSGRALEAAHRGLGITDAQYDLVGAHLTAVLEELGASERAITAVTTTLGAVRPDIVEAERPDS